MKKHQKHRGKRRKKKGKPSQGRAKELSSTEEDETNLREEEDKEDKELKPDEINLNDLVCADTYSLYARTSRKKGKTSESHLEKYEEDRKLVNKGQHKSFLPPLREKRQTHKRLTFVDERRANEQSIFNTKPSWDMRNKLKNVAPALSESRNKLALSLSFAGIYDLDDMGVETKRNKKLDGILKSSKEGTGDFETLDETEGTSDEVTKCDKEINASERTKHYVIKTLTLEDERPSRQKTLFQDKLILPRIKKHTLSRLNKFVDDECKTAKARESESMLLSIGQTENKISKFADNCSKRTHRHRRKERVHDNSSEQFYLETNIPQLPLLVNGRITLSHSGQLDA